MVNEDELWCAGKCQEDSHDILSHNLSGIRSKDFTSLIALDSGSLINNPCTEFLVMQREVAAKGLSCSNVPLRYDIRRLAGSQETSSGIAKKQSGPRKSWEIVDTAFHLMIPHPTSSTAPRRWRERIMDTALEWTLLSYSYASASQCCIIVNLILLEERNVRFTFGKVSMSMKSRYSYLLRYDRKNFNCHYRNDSISRLS